MGMFAKIKSLSSDKEVLVRLREEFLRQPLQPEEVLGLEDITHLPLPVHKYLIYTRTIGKIKPQNLRIEFAAEMFRKPGDQAMKACSKQYNFLGDFSRIFLMKARKMCIPFLAKHFYSQQQATFVVRVAGMFKVVDIKGEELTTAETVTLLNDLCLFAPGALTDRRLSWKEIDALSCEVTLLNGRFRVSARLFFNEKGELINFISDDRSALQDDGTIKQARWSTPVGEYREMDGRLVPTYGETIWHYPEGDFTYGKFRLKDIQYNVSHE